MFFFQRVLLRNAYDINNIYILQYFFKDKTKTFQKIQPLALSVPIFPNSNIRKVTLILIHLFGSIGVFL